MLRTAHRIFTAFSANLATLPLVVMGRAGKSRARAGLRKIASGRRAFGLGPGPDPSLVIGAEDGLPFASCRVSSRDPHRGGRDPVAPLHFRRASESASGCVAPSVTSVDTGEGKKARVNALLDHSPYMYVCVCTLFLLISICGQDASVTSSSPFASP